MYATLVLKKIKKLLNKSIPIHVVFVHVAVAGDDKWKLVAEKLGLNQDEIRFLDLRHKNPVEALLIFITNQRPAERPMNVGELYNILCECGIPVIADKL